MQVLTHSYRSGTGEKLSNLPIGKNQELHPSSQLHYLAVELILSQGHCSFQLCDVSCLNAGIFVCRIHCSVPNS